MGGPCSPDFPKSTITAGPRTTHYAAQSRKANIVFILEMEREEGGGLGLGHRISAAGQHRKASYCLRGLRLGHGQDSELRQIHNRDSGSDSDFMSHGG